MSAEQELLIRKARSKYGDIFPCGNNTEWERCFSVYRGKYYLWFNTIDNSTHIQSPDEA